MPGGLTSLMVIALLFCLWHASTALGVRLMLAFFAITAGDLVGIRGDRGGDRAHLRPLPLHLGSGPWLGSVPILIPLAWFLMVYPTYILANLLAGGWPIGTPGRRGDLVRLALLSALLMTAWDLVLDPILSGPTIGAWVWEQGGPFYGVPLQNYVGWIATTFTVYLLYRSAERRWPLQVEPLTGSRRFEDLR